MDVDRIVAGLSENMANAISYSRLFNGARFLPRFVNEQTRKALAARGLVMGTKLTDLGLQVRARLTQETDHG
jgi:hypothetical protein